MVRALALVSGGLDSLLAAKLVKNLGVDVIGIHFVLPFQKRKNVEIEGINVVEVKIGLDYLDILRHPKYGFGSALNPCIDCKIFLLKKARELMKKYNADFIVMGDVLGQRPMTQNLKAMKIIEKESGLEGLILRPLTAKNLPPTVPEEKGWVDRSKLYDIRGRSRRRQIQLAKELGIENYEQPAGGCRLTQKEYGEKLKRRLELEEKIGQITENDISLLSVGRHFFNDSWLVVGRNEEENKKLLKLSRRGDVLVIPEFPGPTVLIRGKKDVQRALELILRYK